MIRFNEDWLRAPDMCEWLVKVSNDDSRAYCRWCAIILRAHKSDLTTHSATAKHAKNRNAPGVPVGPLNVQIVSSDDPQNPEDKSDVFNTPTQSLMPRTQYAKRYRVEWEQMEELKDWLQAFEGDQSKAYCKVCHVQLRAHKHDLVLHGKSSKHKRASSEAGIIGDTESNFITVAFETLNDSSGDVLVPGLQPPFKKSRTSESEDIIEQGIIVETESTPLDGICEESEILTQTQQDLPEIKQEEDDKKVGEISIIRVPAHNNRGSLASRQGSFRKRRMVVTEVLSAIAMNEFTGYELLQIVKAAVPKL